MCYSAKLWASWRGYNRAFGANIDIRSFVRLYAQRAEDPSIKIPRQVDAAFLEPTTADEEQISKLIQAHDQQQITALEQEIFAQRTRLADAERKLRAKATKAASESARIAASKVERALEKLAALKSPLKPDSPVRIFPGSYVPLLVAGGEQPRIVLARYLCRPAGKPESYDRRFPGTYNARRDSLEGYWKELFGASHAVVAVEAFYENVSRHRLEQRELAPGESEQNVVLQFQPRPAHTMFAACLWSHWHGPGGAELISFAAITDEPPPEVAAAGHDRCIIPLQRRDVPAWLSPSPDHLADAYALLDRRETPYFEHREAA